MKKLLVFCFSLCLFTQAHASVGDSVLSEKGVREKILNDIQENLNHKNRTIDSTITTLDNRVGKLDSVLKTTGNPKERIDKLVERVQVLEEKQKAIEQNELNVYEANYQSALINLVSMDREIKPLVLFRCTKDFFDALTETGNPINYAGFRDGYDKFRVYIDKTKDKNATLKAVSEVVGASGGFTAGIPIVGAYSQLLFSGMAEYINSIGHKRRDLKEGAEKMFAITTALSQFATDKNQIETEWDGITQSLEEMQVSYDSVMNRNMRMVGLDICDMGNCYTKQSDASKRYQYLTMLREKAAAHVLEVHKDNPKEWKEDIYYQLMDVQTLKIRYGDIAYRITHHINMYSTLIAHYKNNKEIGEHVAKLDEKLGQLKSTFDDTFEPTQYAHAATQMYKVL